jgi:hypothetical protein
MIHIDNIPITPGPVPSDVPSDVNSNDEEFDCGLPNLHDLSDDEDSENGGCPS